METERNFMVWIKVSLEQTNNLNEKRNPLRNPHKVKAENFHYLNSSRFAL